MRRDAGSCWGTCTAAVLRFAPHAGNVVAFNLGQAGCSGEVWDNVAFDLAEGDAAARATHWFLTACHELAHNWVRNHSSQFADVMGELVLHFAPRFRSLWPS